MTLTFVNFDHTTLTYLYAMNDVMNDIFLGYAMNDIFWDFFFLDFCDFFGIFLDFWNIF